MRNALRYLLLPVTLAVCGHLHAQTVYKSVDEKGNVTYSESPPPETKKGAIRSTKELPIDPNQNIMPAQPINAAPPPTSQANQSGNETQDRVAAAAAALRAAEEAQRAGNAAQPGDFRGKASGGVGPSSQRLERLDELQRAVDEARQNLENAQHNRSSD